MTSKSIMWKEEIKNLKFPYTINSEVDAENILFKISPERLVLLKWIYTLLTGFLNDISSKELAVYFLNLGIVEGDPFEFVEGNSPKKHQKKVWNNLFHFAKMMKYSPEVSQSFAEKYSHEMPPSYSVADGDPPESTKKDSLSLEPDIPDLDNIISTLEEEVNKPVLTISEENKTVLSKLKEYLNRLSLINAQIKPPELTEVKNQSEFGNLTADLCKEMQTLESVLVSSSNVMSSMRQLEKKLDDHLSKSGNILELVSNLKRFNGDF